MAAGFLPRVPASFFGIVLGLAGLANDWRAAHAAWSLPAGVGDALVVVATVAWLVIAVLYAGKWIVAAGVAKDEAAHTVNCCFIGLAGVATMLVAQGIAPWSRTAAVVLFAAGATFTL
ncbi:MAG TPA: hypothetical protein VJ724_03170, partial [Tahibacter sp.]|nr:hypothetical protein [Tahibacter sp.]